MEDVALPAAEWIAEALGHSTAVQFTGQGRTEKYAWIERVLAQQCYGSLSNKQRGVVRTLLSGAAGLSLAQVTRLIRQYRQSGHIGTQRGMRRGFPVKYTAADLDLLVEVDHVHRRLSGPATRHILEREWQVFGKRQYARLAGLSVAHLYNLRHSTGYRQRMAELPPAPALGIDIGTRRQPQLKATPGYLRVHSSYQAGRGGHGIHHVTAVDAVTQWQLAACVSQLNSQSLLPMLETLLHQCPFRVLEFRAARENGLGNDSLARLLNQHLPLLRSAPDSGRDGSLEEADGAPTPGRSGDPTAALVGEMRRFYCVHVNPYLNYHRPCSFSRIHLDERGNRRRHYHEEDCLTPYERLRSLPQSHRYLRDGIGWEHLDRVACLSSDTDAARHMICAMAELSRRFKLEGECLTDSLC